MATGLVNLTGYEIIYLVKATGQTTKCAVNASTRSAVLKKLIPFTKYAIIVRSVTTVGTVNYNGTQLVLTTKAPGKALCVFRMQCVFSRIFLKLIFQ